MIEISGFFERNAAARCISLWVLAELWDSLIYDNPFQRSGKVNLSISGYGNDLDYFTMPVQLILPF